MSPRIGLPAVVYRTRKGLRERERQYSVEMVKLFLIFLAAVVFSVAGGASPVEESCDGMRDLVDYDFCVSALSADERSTAAAADARTLALVAVDRSAASAGAARAAVAEMLKSEDDPEVRSGLQACGLLYSGAQAAMPLVSRSIAARRVVEARQLAPLTDEAGWHCRDALAGGRGAEAAKRLMKQNDEFSQLTLIFTTLVNRNM